jgi:hypothetical protein
MKHQLLFAAALMLTITACGTSVPAVTDQTQTDVTLEATRVKRPPVAPTPKPVNLANGFYFYDVVINGARLGGALTISNQSVPNQPGALRANLSVRKADYLQAFPTSAAVVASWVPFESLPGFYEQPVYYGLPAIITVGANNSIGLKTGNPDPNSLNQGVVALNLVGQFRIPGPTPVGGVGTPEIVGNPAAPGTTPVTSWSAGCIPQVLLNSCK